METIEMENSLLSVINKLLKLIADKYSNQNLMDSSVRKFVYEKIREAHFLLSNNCKDAEYYGNIRDCAVELMNYFTELKNANNANA